MDKATAAPVAEYRCEVCGKTFPSGAALGGHRSSHKRTGELARAEQSPRTPKAQDFSIKAQVNEALRETILPLQTQLADISARIERTQSELTELREARSTLESVLKKLGVMPTASTSGRRNGAALVADRSQQAKTAKLRELIETSNPDVLAMFADGNATANRIADWWQSSGVQPQASLQTIRKGLEELRDIGIVRADRVVKGGGMAWQLVNGTGGQS